MRISRLVLIVVAVVGVSLASGCSSHRLREGIWELSHHAQVAQNQLEFPLPNREVKVLVEWKDSGDGEVVQISSIDDQTSSIDDQTSSIDDELEPMFGDIIVVKEKTVLTIDHMDDFHHIRMWGEIRDPENVMGTMFVASSRQFEDLMFEGRWKLRWLRDS